MRQISDDFADSYFILPYSERQDSMWLLITISFLCLEANTKDETGNVINYQLTGGGRDILDLTNFASHVCWAIDLRPSLCVHKQRYEAPP